MEDVHPVSGEPINPDRDEVEIVFESISKSEPRDEETQEGEVHFTSSSEDTQTLELSSGSLGSGSEDENHNSLLSHQPAEGKKKSGGAHRRKQTRPTRGGRGHSAPEVMEGSGEPAPKQDESNLYLYNQNMDDDIYSYTDRSHSDVRTHAGLPSSGSPPNEGSERGAEGVSLLGVHFFRPQDVPADAALPRSATLLNGFSRTLGNPIAPIAAVEQEGGEDGVCAAFRNAWSIDRCFTEERVKTETAKVIKMSATHAQFPFTTPATPLNFPEFQSCPPLQGKKGPLFEKLRVLKRAAPTTPTFRRYREAPREFACSFCSSSRLKLEKKMSLFGLIRHINVAHPEVSLTLENVPNTFVLKLTFERHLLMKKFVDAGMYPTQPHFQQCVQIQGFQYCVDRRVYSAKALYVTMLRRDKVKMNEGSPSIYQYPEVFITRLKKPNSPRTISTRYESSDSEDEDKKPRSGPSTVTSLSVDPQGDDKIMTVIQEPNTVEVTKPQSGIFAAGKKYAKLVPCR